MPTKKRDSEEVGDVLRAVLARIDPDQRLQAFEVWNFWNDLVGDGLARRAQPSGYRNGVLIVTVAAHAWMQELQFMKETLRVRLNERLGKEMIRDIYFVSGAVPPPAIAESNEPEHEPAAPASPVELPEISDPELAASFRRLVDAHARRRRTGSKRRK